MVNIAVGGAVARDDDGDLLQILLGPPHLLQLVLDGGDVNFETIYEI